MRSRVVHISFVAMLIAFVGLTAVVKTYSVSDDRNVEVESFAWGISSNQVLKICVANVSPGEVPTETIAFHFFQISDQFGHSVAAKELQVPVGKFACTEFSHSFLIAAGLVPEVNQRVQFLINWTHPLDRAEDGANEAPSVGAGRESSVGSIQTIRADTGETQVDKQWLLIAKQRLTVDSP